MQVFWGLGFQYTFYQLLIHYQKHLGDNQTTLNKKSGTSKNPFPTKK